MKSSLIPGAIATPENNPDSPAGKAGSPKRAKARRIAALSAATATLLAVGSASALFVDYLADRALARTSEAAVVRPVVVDTVDITTGHKMAAAALEARAAQAAAVAAASPAAPSTPAAAIPAPAPVVAPLPDAEAIAKVAVDAGQARDIAADEAETDAAAEPPPATEDRTITGAIGPAEARPQPTPARERAEAPKAEKPAQVSSLPGVDVDGVPDPSDDSAVRTVTKPAEPAAKSLGGVPAGPARVTAAVKLRSGPNKNSGVLGVVPAGSSVGVVSCNGWCQVDYGGRKGWVYKNFLAAARPLPPPAKPQQEAADDTSGRRVGNSPRQR